MGKIFFAVVCDAVVVCLRYQPTHRGRLRADHPSALCFNTNP